MNKDLQELFESWRNDGYGTGNKSPEMQRKEIIANMQARKQREMTKEEETIVALEAMMRNQISY